MEDIENEEKLQKERSEKLKKERIARAHCNHLSLSINTPYNSPYRTRTKPTTCLYFLWKAYLSR